MAKRFVPHNSFLTCNKGASPTQLKVTNNSGTHIYGVSLASEADLKPMENILPFGVCSVDQKPCMPQPTQWDKCSGSVSVSGNKLIYEDACLLCKKGGKIEVSFVTPSGFMLALQNQLGGSSSWILGLGIGTGNALGTLGAFAPYAQQAANSRKNLNSNIFSVRHAAKESFGENLSKLDYQANGYKIIGSPHGRAFEQGIDAVAYDSKSGMDILEESKYKKGRGKPYTNSKPTQNGRQGSTRWFHNLIEDRVSPSEAARIRNKLNRRSTSVRPIISKVEPNGTISRYNLLPNGKTGNPANIGPANVTRGTTKAGRAINSIGVSIQSNRGVASANQWLTRNSHTVSRVGKVAGRGAFVLGVAAESYNVYSTYKAEGSFGKETKKAAGSAAGALAGGWAGAQIGASIGSLGGPVGTLVGGVVGGAIGAAVGGGLGKKIGGWFS